MIQLFKPYMPPELPMLDSIIHSGQLSYGKWGRAFENDLRQYIGVNNLMTTNNFTTAIQIALVSLNLEPGDEVIASPMSCLNSTMPLRTMGLKIRWADINPISGTLDPESVRKKITKQTKLIFHNHFCGYMGFVDEINAIGREFQIPVMDDCVEAFGSHYKGNVAGNLGTEISVFSFQSVRLPNTIDGGAIVFKNKEIYERALLARDQGIRRNIFRDEDGEISPNCDIYMRGFAGTLSEINSYIGCEQLKVIDKLITKQRSNAKIWEQKGISCDLLRPDILPNYWIYGTLQENKRNVMQQFKADGMQCSGVHLPNSNYSIFGDIEKLPGVESFNNKFLALPCGWWI